MVAIVLALKEWEYLLKSSQQKIVVWTDYKNMEYFTSSKVLNRHQARWFKFLSELNFIVKYRLGDKIGNQIPCLGAGTCTLKGGVKICGLYSSYSNWVNYKYMQLRCFA